VKFAIVSEPSSYKSYRALTVL